MTRKIKDKIDAEIANMSVIEYLENCRAGRRANSSQPIMSNKNPQNPSLK
jgi:hypothetical protein